MILSYVVLKEKLTCSLDQPAYNHGSCSYDKRFTQFHGRCRRDASVCGSVAAKLKAGDDL